MERLPRLNQRLLAQKGKQAGNLVFFADSYSSWQKGAIENANKLIRKHIPKGTTSRTWRMRSFAKFSVKSIAGHAKKINVDSPKNVFFRQITDSALDSWE